MGRRSKISVQKTVNNIDKLVTIHDRPEGSKLGKYNYIIEAEASGGITDEQISKVCKTKEIRFCGSFNAISK